jgi:hypothetical protein
VRDDRGRSGGEAVSGSEARWVDFSGPVGGGHVAGLSVFPDPRDHDDLSWFVADWGVVTVGPSASMAASSGKASRSPRAIVCWSTTAMPTRPMLPDITRPISRRCCAEEAAMQNGLIAELA